MTKIFVDGELTDWQNIDFPEKIEAGEQLRLSISSDEAYVYLAVEKPADWNWENEELLLAFDNQPGGNETIIDSGINLPFGAEFLLTVKDPNDAALTLASAYDPHTYLYGQVLKMIPFNEAWSQENNGIFLPWKLCLSLACLPGANSF
ncbi:MAG: hypothetical protein U9N81_04475 [Bacillota bacterium]|nr:hypothetical protein [Bacillota bacterium]